jgi:DnaK suppressor protein
MSDFSNEFIEEQKQKLLETKQTILESFRNFSTETKDLGSETLAEEGDQAQKLLDQKLAISLREKDLKKLREIDYALQKIEDGTYGYCEESGEPIELKRLQKQPWARLSIYYAELEERESKQYFRNSP